MASTTNQWKLGLFVVVAFATALGILSWLGSLRLSQETVRVRYFFDEDVSGLEIGGSVKFRGVNMGKVVAIRAANDQRHVEVVAELFVDTLRDLGLPDRGTEGKAFFTPPDLRARLSSSLLTGVAFIQTDYFDPERYPIPELPFPTPSDTIPVVVSSRKQLEQGMVRLVESGPVLADELGRLATRLNRTLDELDLQSIADRARSLLETAEERVATLEELPALARAASAFDEAERAIGELRGAIAAATNDDDGALASVTAAAARVDELGNRIEKALEDADLPGTTAAIRDLSGGVGRTAGEYERLGRDFRHGLDGVWSTFASVRRLAEMLERDPASLVHGKTPTEIRRD